MGAVAVRKIPKALCLLCRTEFQPTRTWHVFCSEACRREARANERSVEYQCVYCGLLADTVDHIPPTSVRGALIETGLAGRYPFSEVRCCRECNSALGARPLWTVSQRRHFIKTWLARRYRKYLAIPDWTEADLATVGKDLEQCILHGLAVRDLTKWRLAHHG